VTVFPRASWRQWRGLVPDADVALEIFNGISYMTPLWLRTPRVVLVHHIHRDHYVAELGATGRVAALALETLPMRLLYRRASFVTVSESSATAIAEHGVPRDRITVNHNGVETGAFSPGPKAPEPTLLYLGRLKRYKRLEWLLDVVEGVPGAVLDVAGDGDHREEFQAAVQARGLGDRVRVHGHVDEARKLELLQRAWVHVTASSAEGWSLTVIEAAACGTPTVAAAAGGMRESVLHERTGILADDAEGLAAATRRLVDDADLRARMGAAAMERARGLTWDRCAAVTLDRLEAERASALQDAAPDRTRPPRTRPLAAMLAAVNLVVLACLTMVAIALGADFALWLGLGDAVAGAALAAFAMARTRARRARDAVALAPARETVA
jgi:glycosyltransferase involved in cell wall biosynthesis